MITAHPIRDNYRINCGTIADPTDRSMDNQIPLDDDY